MPNFQFPSLNALLLAMACALSAPFIAQAGPAPSGGSVLAFTTSGTNEFAFDTGLLRGKLREHGESKGLSSIVYVPTGAKLDASMGCLGHYRVFSANHRYGAGAWYWPSEAILQSDGSVAVRWPSTNDRPFELRAVYRWAAPNALDLETTVVAKTNLTNFESFLASYFAPSFTNSQVYVGELPGQPGVKGFLAAEQSAGHWQVFPREDSVVPLILDGRWAYPPSPVDWVVMPQLAKPLGVRRSPTDGLTAVLMAPPEDCFAVSSPYETEPHYSMYLSLFGRSLKPGETARARARLLIAPGLSDADVLKAYQKYIQEACKT